MAWVVAPSAVPMTIARNVAQKERPKNTTPMKPTKTVANSMFGEVHVQNSCNGRPCRSLSGMNSAPPGSTAMTFSPYDPSLTSMSSLSVDMHTPCGQARPGVGLELVSLAWLARPGVAGGATGVAGEATMGWREERVATLRSRSPRWLYPVLEVPRRLHRVLSPLPPAGPAGPIERKSGTGMPVVGMVGGGQLARMTA